MSGAPGETAPRREPVPPEERTIFAMGGGGFTMEPANPLLDDFVLSLAHAREPRILFLPTASGDTTPQINAFKERFSGRNCVSDHLALFRLRETTRPLRELLHDQDILYVGGGSMRNLLAIWRAHDLDTLLIEAWERGIVLAGLSAGAMCWFQWGLTRSSGPPEPLEGLGLLDGSLTVHADGEPERLPVWLAHVCDGTMSGGWAVDDGVGLLFHGRTLDRIVTSRPGTEALRVDAIAGELVRRRIQPELLGSRASDPLGGYDEAVEELRRVHRLRRGTGGRRR